MSDQSDKTTKSPSAHWAYYISGVSVLFSLVAFIILFEVTNSIQETRAKQIASYALEYRSALLEF